MATVDVIWSAVLGIDSDAVMVRRECTLLPPWAGIASNARDVAAEVLTTWCDLEEWEDWFGMDSGEASAIVIIHEPEAVSGRYRVDLELKVAGRAHELSKEDSAQLDMMLAAEGTNQRRPSA